MDSINVCVQIQSVQAHSLISLTLTVELLDVHNYVSLALGFKVAQLPEKDELNWSKAQLLARLDVAMGGRVAEEIIFGKENVTTGQCFSKQTKESFGHFFPFIMPLIDFPFRGP